MMCISAFCAAAMGYGPVYSEPSQIIATGTIERAYDDVRPTPRPNYKPRGSHALKPTKIAFAASVPRSKAPFEALLGNQNLKLVKVDGDEVINRFTPGMTRILKNVQAKFGCKIEVQSGYRSPARNIAVGGVKRSYHMSGRAADFRVPCAPKEALLKYLRSNPRVGGIGFYMAGGFIHADDGRRREWRY